FLHIYDSTESISVKKAKNGFHHNPWELLKDQRLFITRDADITHKNEKVGVIRMAASKKHIMSELWQWIIETIVVMLFLIVAISFTSFIVAKKYILRPLRNIISSAKELSGGNLEAKIDAYEENELGELAHSFIEMRDAIKKQINELTVLNQKIELQNSALKRADALREEYSHTLEQRVEERTAALARSVAELQALGEVSQAVSATLDLPTVLRTIVSYANQLSGADGGAIYEYDEPTAVFHLRATQQFDQEVIEARGVTPLRMGEGAIGRAVAAHEPLQIPDICAEGAYQGRLRETLERFGFRAILAVPLLREERVVGGLVVCRKSPGAFPPA